MGRAYVLAAFSLMLVACGGGSQQANMESLKAQVGELEARVKSTEQQLEAVSTQLQAQQLLARLDEIAGLKPGADGYSVVRTDLGHLIVSIADVEAYANSTRVTLQFGNPSSATINGVKAALEWGSTDKEGGLGVPLGKKAVSFTESLAPGAWTRAQVVLENIKPAELGYIRMGDFGHRGVNLRRNG